MSCFLSILVNPRSQGSTTLEWNGRIPDRRHEKKFKQDLERELEKILNNKGIDFKIQDTAQGELCLGTK